MIIYAKPSLGYALIQIPEICIYLYTTITRKFKNKLLPAQTIMTEVAPIPAVHGYTSERLKQCDGDHDITSRSEPLKASHRHQCNEEAMNNDFKKSPMGEKIQHILMTLHCPEAYGDWDTDHDLDVAGHLKKWKSILTESLVMILMQCLSNLILLVPLFVTGK